jgi:hypothetical protein
MISDCTAAKLLSRWKERGFAASRARPQELKELNLLLFGSSVVPKKRGKTSLQPSSCQISIRMADCSPERLAFNSALAAIIPKDLAEI